MQGLQVNCYWVELKAWRLGVGGETQRRESFWTGSDGNRVIVQVPGASQGEVFRLDR